MLNQTQGILHAHKLVILLSNSNQLKHSDTDFVNIIFALFVYENTFKLLFYCLGMTDKDELNTWRLLNWFNGTLMVRQSRVDTDEAYKEDWSWSILGTDRVEAKNLLDL